MQIKPRKKAATRNPAPRPERSRQAAGRSLQALYADLRRAAKHPAIWALTAIVVLAFIGFTLTSGETQALQRLWGLIYLAFFTLLTLLFTRGSPGLPRARPAQPPWRVWIGLAVILIVMLATTLYAMAFHHDCPTQLQAFCNFSSLRLEKTWHVGSWPFYPSEFINPLLYLVIPGTALLLLGSRPRELGFAHGHRSLRVMILWAVIPVATFAWLWFTGRVTGLGLAQSAFSNFWQNGMFEEFLFRAALLSRLRTLFGTAWALVVSSLAFGFWHFGADIQQTHGAIIPALSLCVLEQAVFGFAMGVLILRTGNLLAGSVFHVLGNMAG